MKIVAYRSQGKAVHNDVMVDVSEAARDFDIHYPVAVSKAVWHDYITAPPAPEITLSPSEQRTRERDRLWDLLWMLGLCLSETTNRNPSSVGVAG
jgi:hypothetical protein